MNFVSPNFKAKEPLHVVTFDDFRTTDRRIAYPEMRKRGISGTSYVNTGRKGRNWWWSWEMAKEMVLHGDWDLQCHTHDHPHLNQLTAEEVHQQMKMVDESFINAGVEPPIHHAYPYGDHNAMVKEIIMQYRKTQRHVGMSDTFAYDEAAPHALVAVQADIATQADMDRVKLAIDDAYAKDGVIITYSHTIQTSQITDSSQGYLHYFLEMIDYSISKGMKIVTINDAYNILKYHGSA